MDLKQGAKTSTKAGQKSDLTGGISGQSSAVVSVLGPAFVPALSPDFAASVLASAVGRCDALWMGLWLPRYCIRCGKPLAEGKQASALFESAACKQAWQRARAFTRTSPLFAALEERMKRYVGMACWYRLAFRHQGQAWLYPTTQGPSLRFDGLRRATPGFRLQPYEPPVIPIRQLYHITLATESGARVPLPVGDGGPSEIEPCRLLQIEDGERGH